MQKDISLLGENRPTHIHSPKTRFSGFLHGLENEKKIHKTLDCEFNEKRQRRRPQ